MPKLPHVTPSASEGCTLRLYVAGASPSSARAVEVMRAICDDHPDERYELEVVDVYQQPLLALQARVMTIPTLVRVSPGRAPRRIHGHLSDKARVVLGLS